MLAQLSLITILLNNFCNKILLFLFLIIRTNLQLLAYICLYHSKIYVITLKIILNKDKKLNHFNFIHNF